MAKRKAPAKKLIETPLDSSTEEKIKQAARKLFMKKGYAATRTRDISEEAGINLALLNYYFRSKEKLFELIMLESLQHFFKNMLEVLNDKETSLEQKVETFVTNYTDMLRKQPDIPLFIFSEIRNNPAQLVARMGIKDYLSNSYFMKQIQEAMNSGRIIAVNPLQFIINMVGMTVFPFIASPILKNMFGMDEKAFDNILDERKTLIPKWVKAILSNT
jgi:AcrR family transcriptional regulator